MYEDISKSSAESTNKSKFDSNFSYLNYASRFIQRIPSINERTDTGWFPCGQGTDQQINEHLDGHKRIGTFSQWYPAFGILDIDDLKSSMLLDNIRSLCHIGGDGAMVYETSPKSYHVLFRPQYDGKPATVKLFQEIMGPFVSKLSADMRAKKDLTEVDLYPKSNRIIQAPFHPLHRIISPSHPLTNLEDKLQYFDDLPVLDLKSFSAVVRRIAAQSGNQLSTRPVPRPTKGVMQEGADLYEHGMQPESTTRYHSQHKVALWLWRLNLTPEQALDELMTWVRDKTNGFSKDAAAINRGDYRTMQQVRREHENLVTTIWGTFERNNLYPASTHNGFYGWFTKADLLTAARACNGNIPRFKFLSQMLAYFNAHRKQRLNVHSDKLIEWSSFNSYLKHLENLESNGLLHREHQYLAGEFSKVIQLNINPTFASFNDAATLTDGFGQALTFDESLEEVGRKEVYQMLTQNGFSIPSICQFLRGRGI